MGSAGGKTSRKSENLENYYNKPAFISDMDEGRNAIIIQNCPFIVDSHFKKEYCNEAYIRKTENNTCDSNTRTLSFRASFDQTQEIEPIAQNKEGHFLDESISQDLDFLIEKASKCFRYSINDQSSSFLEDNSIQLLSIKNDVSDCQPKKSNIAVELNESDFPSYHLSKLGT